MSKPKCPYCNTTAELVDSSAIYGVSYGWAWLCPKCQDVYVGCHPKSQRPLGRLANKELRIAKMGAHAVFDPLWRDGWMTRKEAYAWLAKAMGLTKDTCHIGMFDVGDCRRVIELVKNRQTLTLTKTD